MRPADDHWMVFDGLLADAAASFLKCFGQLKRTTIACLGQLSLLGVFPFLNGNRKQLVRLKLTL